MLTLVQYPANTEVHDIQLVWDETVNKFYERTCSFPHQLDEDEEEQEGLSEVSQSHAQAEVIAHLLNMFDWMKDNARQAGLVVTDKIKVYSSYEYKGEGQGDDGTDFHYFSVVEVEGNLESPFYFHDDNHANSARQFVGLIAPDFKEPIDSTHKETNMVNDGNPTYIYNRNGTLTFDNSDPDDEDNPLPLASSEDYKSCDRCIGSIFEALNPDEHIKLSDGYFILDDELDLVQDWSIV